MTRYDLWLFLHVVGTILWVGGAVVIQAFGALTQRAGDPARSAAFGRNAALVGTWVFMPACALVLLTGVRLTEDGSWGWSDPFVLVGLAGWAVVAGMLFGYVTPSMRRVSGRMALDGPSAGNAARVRRLVVLARVLLLVLFVIVFVMVVELGA